MINNSYDEVFRALVNILRQVAPLKVTGPIFPETSLAEDLNFDSLDTVDLLLHINEYFSINIDFEKWILQESQRDGKPYTVRSLCDFIIETITMKMNTDEKSVKSKDKHR